MNCLVNDILVTDLRKYNQKKKLKVTKTEKRRIIF